MGKLPKQTKRRDLIKRFKELCFTGPHQGAKGRRGDHPEFMERDGRVVKLPNPHPGDIGEGLLKKVLHEAGVTPEEWLGEPPKQELTNDAEETAPPLPRSGDRQPADRPRRSDRPRRR